VLLITFGTRPEYLKLKPLVDIMHGKIPYKVLFTGQHTDLIHLENCTTMNIFDGDNRLDSIVCSILNNNNIFEDISHVMVQGDTTSSFAVALAAFHRKLPVIHIEAGLRTYDLDHPYPEEFNRQAISSIASYHFCPTQDSANNLLRGTVTGDIFVTGNTILDNLVDVNPFYGEDVLVTMHRRENHDMMREWFIEIDKLAKKYKDLRFVLPIHPNPNVKKHVDVFKYVDVIDPLEYDDLINILAKSKLVITDSGGIQEESSFLKKRSIVCRKITERVEGIPEFHFLASSPNELSSVFDLLVDRYEVNDPCPYGDGKASEKIFPILKELVCGITYN
jgi:UDP-N-acetylglucosamine 2-epimerase (non-hydrolysing)